jgi:hypothetical protein
VSHTSIGGEDDGWPHQGEGSDKRCHNQRSCYTKFNRYFHFRTAHRCFQAADSIVYAMGYKSLDEAEEKMSGNYEAMLELVATVGRIRRAHTAMAVADTYSRRPPERSLRPGGASCPAQLACSRPSDEGGLCNDCTADGGAGD